MAKGKKKQGGKQPAQQEETVEQSLSELSVADDASSSSQYATPASSLTLTSTATSHELAPTPTPHEPTPTPSSTQEPDEGKGDEGGLGLEKPKRKRPPRVRGKKPGQDAEGPAPAGSVQQATPVQAPAQPGPPQQGPPQGFGQPLQGYGPPPRGYGPPPHGFDLPPQGYGPPQDSGPALQGRGPPQAIPGFGPAQQVQVPPQQAQYAPQQARAPPQQVQALPEHALAPPQQAQAPPPQQPLELMKARMEIPPRYDTTRLPSRPLKLLTNYLLMKINPNMKVHRYDVSFKPDRPKKMLPLAFQIVMKQNFPKFMVAFDQAKNFYSVEPLQLSGDKFETAVELKDDNGKLMKFEIGIKMTGVVAFNTLDKYMKSGGTSLNPPTEAIQCVDVVLRQGTLQNYVKSGRQFFKRPANPIDLGDGLEMWTGLFQSAIFTSKPYINIDVAHKGFPIAQPLMKLAASFRLDMSRPIKSQNGYGLEMFLQYIKGLKVLAHVAGTNEKREFICNDVMPPPKDIIFEMTTKDGRKQKTSVLEYFVKEKGCRLQYPNQNCIWVGPRDKKIYYPLELLDVSFAQVRNRQLNDNQLRTMVREAATPPDQRMGKIYEVIRDMKYSTNEYFRKFGLAIDEKFTSVDGKLLPPPKLNCGTPQPTQPERGVWNPSKLKNCASLDRWCVLCVDTDAKRCGADALESNFQNVGRQIGVRVEKMMLPIAGNVRVTELKRRLEEAAGRGAQLVLVVVNSRNKDNYSQVKKIAELHVGMLTQCLKDMTCERKLNPATVKNILLKVNSKLMGVNQAIHPESKPSCMKRPIMMVGADVTHPSPEQTSIPSIAAVTASIDQDCFKYNIEISIQAPKEEMIRDFSGMMEAHLRVFQRALRVLPERIYVFRDGVSEGQFAEVMKTELAGVYSAFRRVAGDERKPPEVLFMLVQKRHHTRFFQNNSRHNVDPGTVVDKDIVHPRELDFYLVSHAAIKGTARPTRYHCVCNSGQASADEVQQVAYHLCHLFSRCARAVSLPAPTYYAHLAAARAKALTHGEVYDFKDLERNPRRLNIKQNLHDNNPMFFV